MLSSNMGNSEASEITAFKNHLSLCESFGFRAVDLEVILTVFLQLYSLKNVVEQSLVICKMC